MPDNSRPQRFVPPHMQNVVQQQARNIDDDHDAGESRRAALKRRKLAIQFDIDQGELALSPDNPWVHRIELLTEALANVESELSAARNIEAQPFYALPATQVTNITVSEAEPFEVSFAIGEEQFGWSERLDWTERGGLLAQPDFVQDQGSVRALVPETTPAELVESLVIHLQNSVMSFAVALRDARLNGESLPVDVVMSDLAAPCPVCGGWREYNGVCNACAVRKSRDHSLFLERKRLMSERAVEAEERHRLGERLPLALRRMADLERELAQLGG